MKAATLLEMMRGGKLTLAVRLQPLAKPFYRICFIGGALRHGMLEPLKEGPARLEALVDRLAPGPGGQEALESWLRIGCLVGELEEGPEGYRLRGGLSKALADATHDATAAMVVETVTLHHKLLVEGPGRLRAGGRFTLDDQEGDVIARSSRILEPIVTEAVRGFVPKEGTPRLLEVGCGSGIYLRRAAEVCPGLVGLGLELQPEVADQARSNLERWGLGGAFQVEVGDVRAREPASEDLFDLVTLHNNIYYFPVEERVELLAHLRRFLRPGGRILLTTGTLGGGLVMEVLNLWSAATEGCGRLPAPAELEGQLREAGFDPEPPRALVPGQAYHAFVGRAV